MGSLYFGKLFPMGVEALAEAVELVRAGTAPRIEQDHGRASYERLVPRGGRGGRLVEAGGRGAPASSAGPTPSPAPGPPWAGTSCKLYGTRLGAGAGAPGEILDLSDAGMAVAAGGASVLVQRVRAHDSGTKVAAADYAGQAGLRPGSCLG